jgi:hypothetical protein
MKSQKAFCPASIKIVIAGLVPAIHHATISDIKNAAQWIAGINPAMTKEY